MQPLIQSAGTPSTPTPSSFYVTPNTLGQNVTGSVNNGQPALQMPMSSLMENVGQGGGGRPAPIQQGMMPINRPQGQPQAPGIQAGIMNKPMIQPQPQNTLGQSTNLAQTLNPVPANQTQQPWQYNQQAQYAQHDQQLNLINALHQAVTSDEGKQFQKGIPSIDWGTVHDKIQQTMDNINNAPVDTDYIGGHGVINATKAAVNGGSYMDIAQGMLGKTAGADHATLTAFFQKAGEGKVDPRNTPWCAAFANAVIQNGGGQGTGSLAARSFLNFGEKVKQSDATKGDVVVFSDLTGNNNPAHGHVGFVDHFSSDGSRVFVLGGNQSHSVMIKSFPTSKVLGYRRPPNADEVKDKMVAGSDVNGQGGGGAGNTGVQLVQNNRLNPEMNKYADNPAQNIQPPQLPQGQQEETARNLDQGLSYE